MLDESMRNDSREIVSKKITNYEDLGDVREIKVSKIALKTIYNAKLSFLIPTRADVFELESLSFPIVFWCQSLLVFSVSQDIKAPIFLYHLCFPRRISIFRESCEISFQLGRSPTIAINQ